MKHFNTYITACLLVSVFVMAPGAARAQNQMDEQGRKTGHWVVEYPNGKTMYEGDFLEGNPVGEMIRYTEEGHMKARIRFYPDNKRFVTLYFPGKKKAAEGVKVYFLYDEIGCHKLPGSYLEDMQRAGIQTSAFHTTKGKANRFQLNFRNQIRLVNE